MRKQRTDTTTLTVGEYVRFGPRGKLDYRVANVNERRVMLEGFTNGGRNLLRFIRHSEPNNLVRTRDLYT